MSAAIRRRAVRLRARSVSKFSTRASFRLSRFFRIEYIRSMVRGRICNKQKAAEGGLLPAARPRRHRARAPGGHDRSAQVVEVFRARGVKLSEATFRKYVQLGLLAAQPAGRPQGQAPGIDGALPVDGGAAGQRHQADDGRELHDRGDPALVPALQGRDRSGRARAEGAVRRFRARAARRPSSIRGAGSSSARSWPTRGASADDLVGRIEGLERQIVSPLERAARARAFSSGASGGAGDLL